MFYVENRLSENWILILLGVAIFVALLLVFWVSRRAKRETTGKYSVSRHSGNEYGYGATYTHTSSPRVTFAARDAQRRKELESRGWTGRTNSELDVLNRKLTDSLSVAEIRRRVRAREAAGLPTGQLRAAARDRGIDLD